MTGAGARTRNKLPKQDADNASRRYPPRPLVGVGALVFRRASVLLVERGKEPLKGFWSLPGGLVETGELLAAAVEREVVEETSLVVKAAYLAEIFERIMRDAAGSVEYHYVLADYVCMARGGELQAAGDAADARWHPVAKLRQLRLTEGTREVIERTYAEYKRRRARV